jgi:type-F conjugative transfer system pilin assembly thiol-disulfide isomerase TrbB
MRINYLHWVVAIIIMVCCAMVAKAETAADTLAAVIAHKTTVASLASTTSMPLTNGDLSDVTILSNKKAWGDSWGLIYIFSSQCSYCQRFSPVLAAVSQQHAIPVYAYAVDGQGLPDYPTPLTANDTVLRLFYGDQPVLYPATFLVHLHSKRFVPLTRGMVDRATLQQTLQAMLNDQQVTASLT